MKLSMWIIADWLGDSVLKAFADEGEMSISGVRLFSGDIESFSLEHVYAGWAEDVFNGGNYKGTVMLVHRTEMIFVGGKSLDDVINSIFSAFDYYNEWEESLWQAVNKQGAMQRLVDLSESVIPCPMRISGVEGNVIGISGAYGADEVDERWKTVKETGYIPLKIGGPVTTAQNAIVPGWGPSPDIYVFSETGRRYIASLIYVEGETIASIMIWEHKKKLTQADCQLASVLCEAAKRIAEIQGAIYSIRPGAAVFTDLLDGKGVGDHELDRVAGGHEAPYRCVCIRNVSSNAELVVKSRIISAVRPLSSAAAAFIYKGEAIAIIYDSLIEEFLSSLEGLASSQLIIGISYQFYEWGHLPVCYRQALYLVGQSGNAPGVYYCKDYALGYMLEQIKLHEMVMELAHPALETLERYDKSQGTQLYQTLFTYLSLERNTAASSEALFIHRNTLIFRVKRIESLIGSDLDSFEERYYILLSYLLRNVGKSGS